MYIMSSDKLDVECPLSSLTGPSNDQENGQGEAAGRPEEASELSQQPGGL